MFTRIKKSLEFTTSDENPDRLCKSDCPKLCCDCLYRIIFFVFWISIGVLILWLLGLLVGSFTSKFIIYNNTICPSFDRTYNEFNGCSDPNNYSECILRWLIYCSGSGIAESIVVIVIIIFLIIIYKSFLEIKPSIKTLEEIKRFSCKEEEEEEEEEYNEPMTFMKKICIITRFMVSEYN